jgi:signal transduction histidine kinase
MAGENQDTAEAANRERLAELGALAGGLVHELKNPLGVIMLNAELLRQQVDGMAMAESERERMRRRLDRILGSSRNLQEVASSFLGFARPQRPDPEAIDLNALLAEVADEQHEFDEHQGITTTLRLDPALPLVPADRLQLRSVFGNILKNAREALRERTGERRVLVVSRAAPGLARVMIINNGPPIPETVLAHLFQPFSSGKEDGTGLGLAIVRRLMDLHHGRVEVSSDPQQGVSFTLEFPTSLGAAQTRAQLPLPDAETEVRDDAASNERARDALPDPPTRARTRRRARGSRSSPSDA